MYVTNAVHPSDPCSDHLESLLFIADYRARVTVWIRVLILLRSEFLTQPVTVSQRDSQPTPVDSQSCKIKRRGVFIDIICVVCIGRLYHFSIG